MFISKVKVPYYSVIKCSTTTVHWLMLRSDFPGPSYVVLSIQPSVSKCLFQPLPHFLEVIEERSFTSEVYNFLPLYDTYSFEGDTVGHIGVIVHAVCNHLALWGDGVFFQEFVSCSTSVFLVSVFLYFIGAHTRSSPAVRGMSLINVDQKEIGYIGKLLHHLAEGWQLAYKGGSGG